MEGRRTRLYAALEAIVDEEGEREEERDGRDGGRCEGRDGGRVSEPCAARGSYIGAPAVAVSLLEPEHLFLLIDDPALYSSISIAIHTAFGLYADLRFSFARGDVSRFALFCSIFVLERPSGEEELCG